MSQPDSPNPRRYRSIVNDFRLGGSLHHRKFDNVYHEKQQEKRSYCVWATTDSCDHSPLQEKLRLRPRNLNRLPLVSRFRHV